MYLLPVTVTHSVITVAAVHKILFLYGSVDKVGRKSCFKVSSDFEDVTYYNRHNPNLKFEVMMNVTFLVEDLSL